jgi:hypothetical protein
VRWLATAVFSANIAACLKNNSGGKPPHSKFSRAPAALVAHFAPQ